MAKENKENIAEPYIGSYVLETLTTGMYAESRNALREYIQNSFDAIRTAVRGKVIKQSEGRITDMPGTPLKLTALGNQHVTRFSPSGQALS